jgi:hypothetical protein
MPSGSSCRMSRRYRPRESEISCYRHGSDPPEGIIASSHLQDSHLVPILPEWALTRRSLQGNTFSPRWMKNIKQSLSFPPARATNLVPEHSFRPDMALATGETRS